MLPLKAIQRPTHLNSRLMLNVNIKRCPSTPRVAERFLLRWVNAAAVSFLWTRVIRLAAYREWNFFRNYIHYGTPSRLMLNSVLYVMLSSTFPKRTNEKSVKEQKTRRSAVIPLTSSLLTLLPAGITEAYVWWCIGRQHDDPRKWASCSHYS